MRRMILAAVWAVFCCSIASFGQGTTTTYTGTIKDLTGTVVTSGRITWTLNAPTGGSIPGTGSFVAATVSCLINATGNPVSSADGLSPCTIVNNSALTPVGTSYTVCRQPYYTTPGSCFVTYANGGTVDLSVLVPTPGTTPNYGVVTGPYVWSKTFSGFGAPTDPCSAIVNVWGLEINQTPADFQCSNATGVYQWNPIGGTSSIIPGSNISCTPNVAGVCAGNVTINASGAGSPVVTTAPTFSPGNGYIGGSTSVTLSCNVPSSTALYCLDQVDQCAPVSIYTTPVSVSAPGLNNIRAVCLAPNMVESPLSVWQGNVISVLPTPTFSPNGGGTFNTTQSVAINFGWAMTGVNMYYTTNGTTPTCSSTLYSSPVAVGTTMTIKAIACGPTTGFGNSAVASATYTINLSAPTVATPVITPAAGNYSLPQTITITDSTGGASIYWDYAIPNGHSGTHVPLTCANGTLYTAPFNLTNPFPVEAISCLGGDADSAVASNAYNLYFPPPAFSFPSPYTGPAATIALNTPGMSGTTIVYGTASTAAACVPTTTYTTGLSFSASEFICAYAYYSSGYGPSSAVVTWQGTLAGTSSVTGGIPGSVARADGGGATAGSQYLTPSGMYEFGDSICAGTGATAVSGYTVSPYAYIYGLHMMYGEPFFNDCISGSQAQDAGNSIYAAVTPTLGQNIPVQQMTGTNDVHLCGTSAGCESNYTAALTSLAAWASIPNEFKLIPQTAITGTACSTTGTWTNTTVGVSDLALQTIVAGSTITCTSYGGAITLPAVYVNWLCTSTGTSSATFAINGSNVGTLSGGGFSSQACSTGNGSTTAEFGQRFALTGSGPYTYKITVNTAAGGNPFTVLWMGSPLPFPLQQSNIGAPTANPPVIGIAGVPKQQNDANSAATAAYNTLAQNVATALAGDGADVVFIPVRNYLDTDSATTDCDMSGCTLPNGDVVPVSASPGLHPNGGTSNGHWVGGHKHLRDAFIAAMPPAPPNYAATLTCNTYQANGLGSTYQVGQFDCFDFLQSSGGGVTITLPQFTATGNQPTSLNNGNALVRIQNTFGYVVPINAGTGVFSLINIPPGLAPGQSMTLKGFWWNNSGTQEYSWMLLTTMGPESYQDWFYALEFGNFSVARGQSFYYEASASATATIGSSLGTSGPYSIYNGTGTNLTITGTTGNLPAIVYPATMIVFRSVLNNPIMEACYGANCPVKTPLINGVTDASSAAAGNVGEDMVSNIAAGSAVSLTTATPKTVTSLALTAGDWSVEGNCNFTASNATVALGATWEAGLSTTTNTLPSDGTEIQMLLPAITTTSFKDGGAIPWKQVDVSSSTTVYLVCEATFTAGTVGGYGHIEARRMR